MMKKVIFPYSLVVVVNSLCFWTCFDSERDGDISECEASHNLLSS